MKRLVRARPARARQQPTAQMSEILFHYEQVAPTTWAYLSSLLVIAIFFKFSRLWSVRNLDLFLVILLAPGLVCIQYGEAADRVRLAAAQNAAEAAPADPMGADIDPMRQRPGEVVDKLNRSLKAPSNVAFFGYIWMFCLGALLATRLLLDPLLTRRPLLEPNLSTGGLVFLGSVLLVFLVVNVATGPLEDADRLAVRAADDAEAASELTRRGPGLPFLDRLPLVQTQAVAVEGDPGGGRYSGSPAVGVLVRIFTIFANVALITGMVLIGYWHFDNFKLGAAAAVLYLILPYAAQMSGRPDHVAPAALLVWSVVLYRRPIVAGLLLGLAMGVSYYPLYLLPLWISFYWERGRWRFISGVAAALIATLTLLFFLSESWGSFGRDLQRMFGLWWPLIDHEFRGVWGAGRWDPVFRLPILVAYFGLVGSFVFWPLQKNLGALMSCTGAVLLATQFWHGFGGGTYLAWYLPLMLLTVFRPNLEDRLAVVVLAEGWLPRRREIGVETQAA